MIWSSEAVRVFFLCPNGTGSIVYDLITQRLSVKSHRTSDSVDPACLQAWLAVAEENA